MIRKIIGPLLLILICPPLVFVFWYTNTAFEGSFITFWNFITENGFIASASTILGPVFWGSPTAWAIISSFAITQLILMKLVPGKMWTGPITPSGNEPIYKSNGVACFLITLLLFYLGAYPLELFSPTIVYDHFGEILGALNVFSLLFCLFLYFKGRFFPSTTDSGITKTFIFDYYWGTELYPRVFGWDIKMFTNCRFGMMSWPLILLSFAAKQEQLYGISDSMIIAVCLQFIYITKFFIWEPGYLRSLDIMHDRAGFYICWGCLVWVPGFYTSPTLYLVNHPNHLGLVLSTLIFIAGAAAIFINFSADRQRQKIRKENGQCTIWNKKPEVTIASYTTSKGEKKTSLLLASGWWKIARHFHYVPEIAAAFFWSLPALFSNILPYIYVIFLAILLIERAFRDDIRCKKKYGKDWQIHCQKVPYKILPYIF
ncbi:MAG: hypothetical protein P4L16_04170 [Chlamydiales bacterium]|nr:hypothetical protein [Chlamydiales bacterium]